MLIEGLCLRCFTVIYSSLTWPQHVYFGTLVTIFYQEYRLHQLVPTLHQLHLGPPAVTFLDKWLSLLTPQVCLQWLTDRIDHHSSCSCICAGGRGKEWKSGKRIQRSAWIDRHRVVPRMVSSERDVRCEYLWRGFNYTWGRLVRRSS